MSEGQSDSDDDSDPNDENAISAEYLRELLETDPSRIQVRIEQSSFQGPVPSPEVVAEYSLLVPDAAERLFAMAEREQASRLAVVDRQLRMEEHESGARIEDGRAARAERTRGQLCGVLIAVLAFLTVICLSLIGAHVTAGILAGATLLGLVSVFVVGRTYELKRRQDAQSVELSFDDVGDSRDE